MLSTKAIATYCDYDPRDCTSVGCDYTLYSDGRVAVETRNCWQGARSGERWTTNPGAVAVDDAGPDGSDDDLLARLTAWAEQLQEDATLCIDGIAGLPGLRRTRGGHVIR